MADRRQSDRRDGSSSSKKKFTISLTSFIYICVIFVMLITSIFVTSYLVSLAYEIGYEEGYEVGLSDGHLTKTE